MFWDRQRKIKYTIRHTINDGEKNRTFDSQKAALDSAYALHKIASLQNDVSQVIRVRDEDGHTVGKLYHYQKDN